LHGYDEEVSSSSSILRRKLPLLASVFALLGPPYLIRAKIGLGLGLGPPFSFKFTPNHKRVEAKIPAQYIGITYNHVKST
jgi:hypothetical protein